MRPEERSMIVDLFDRIAAAPQDNNDRDAERLIRDAAARDPNSAYVLVQTVLVQEEALRRADERIRELQAQVADQGEREPRSFLGSGRRLGASGGTGSVPNAGSRPMDADAPWRAGDARSADPVPSRAVQSGPQAAPGGGGFLGTALSTAGGVAGGMLLADGIRSLFGGGHAGDLWGSSAAAGETKADSSSVDQAAKDKAQDAEQDADDDQDALQDAEYNLDDGGWDGGDSFDV